MRLHNVIGGNSAHFTQGHQHSLAAFNTNDLRQQGAASTLDGHGIANTCCRQRYADGQAHDRLHATRRQECRSLFQTILETGYVHTGKLPRFVADWPPGSCLCDPWPVRIVHLLFPLAAVGALSCKASVKADINTSAEAETETSEASTPMQAAAEPLPPPVLQTEYFGVARGLTLTSKQREPSCKCVAAVVGAASDPNFQWHGYRPDVGVDALVVGVSDEGIECEHPGRGPSIAAIDQVGNDIVIVLEEFKDTRPIALGAIIPNPGPGGSIYLRSRGRTPYGKPIGQGYGRRRNLCKVGEGTQGAALSGGLP